MIKNIQYANSRPYVINHFFAHNFMDGMRKNVFYSIKNQVMNSSFLSIDCL